MKNLGLVLRIIALLSFFAPWATCSWKQSAPGTTFSEPADSTRLHTSTKSTKDTATPVVKTGENEDWNYSVFYPTDGTVSGIGLGFFGFDNPAYFTLEASGFISLFLLFNWKFLRFKFRRGYLLIVNFASITAFAVTIVLREHEKLLWGIWLYIACVLLQLLIEIRLRDINKSIGQ
jgi:hypothetical protein